MNRNTLVEHKITLVPWQEPVNSSNLLRSRTDGTTSPLLFFVVIAIAFSTWGCHSTPPLPVHRFPSIALKDTLSFSAVENTVAPETDTISKAVFFQSIPFEMWEEIQDLADTTESRVLPRAKFALNNRYDAWHVEIQYSWFIQESLWIYDTRENRFTDRITVAEWYGGEGGQVRTAAWLWRQQNALQLIQRSWERNIRLEGDEVATHYQDFVALWEFRDGQFTAIPVQDSAHWINALPLERLE